MAPPSFGDLGKSANDLFSKDYTLGTLKVDVKGKAKSGLDLKLAGSHNLEKGTIGAELEYKYSIKKHGLVITERLKSNSLWLAEVALEEKLVKGLKTTLEASFQPLNGKKSAKVKNSWKNSMSNLALDLDFKSPLPVANANAVAQYGDFLGGANVSVDVEQQKVTKLAYSIAYQLKDMQLFAGVENGTNFSGSAYHQVNRRLETGTKFSWASNTHLTNFGVAAKYKLNGDSFVKFKADNGSILSAAYSFKPNSSVRVTLCASVDGKNLNAGRHQVGGAITFEQ